ncbi:MAG: hypothetical protein OHK0053_30460 [Microscillaceae bacterium]
MKFLPQLLTGLAFWLALTGCENSPEPNPCQGKASVSAAFIIQEAPYNWFADEWTYYDTDTIVTYRAIFTATEEDAEYEWILGSETIHEPSFYREAFPENTPIPVTLKVRKTPNQACFPDDDGEASLTRFFVFINETKAAYIGRYWGVNLDKPEQSFEVGILSDTFPDSRYPDERILRITNLYQDGYKVDYDNRFDVQRGYKQLYFGFHYNFDCYQPIGTARVHGPANDSITIDYTITRLPDNDYHDDRLPKTFKGKRIL